MGPENSRSGTLFDWGCAASDYRGEDWVQFLYEEPASDDLSVMRATVFKARRNEAKTISLVVAASDYYALFFGDHEWIGQLMEELTAGGVNPREAQLRALYAVALLRQGARDWSLGLSACLQRMEIDQEECQFPSSGLHLFAVAEISRVLGEFHLPKTSVLASFLPIEHDELLRATGEVSGTFHAMREYFKGDCHPMYNIFTGIQSEQIAQHIQAATPQTLR